MVIRVLDLAKEPDPIGQCLMECDSCKSGNFDKELITRKIKRVQFPKKGLKGLKSAVD